MILQNIASVKSPLKRPSFSPRHKNLILEGVRKYLKMDVGLVRTILFTDETRATLEDLMAEQIVVDEHHQRMTRQQKGG